MASKPPQPEMRVVERQRTMTARSQCIGGAVGREEGNPRRGANPNHPNKRGLPDGVVPFLLFPHMCNATGCAELRND